MKGYSLAWQGGCAYGHCQPTDALIQTHVLMLLREEDKRSTLGLTVELILLGLRGISETASLF